MRFSSCCTSSSAGFHQHDSPRRPGGDRRVYRLQIVPAKVWRHAAHVGSEQLLVFCTTVLVTVSTDLLLGIISGMVLEFVLNVSFAWPTARVPSVALATPAPSRLGQGALGLVSRFTDLFPKSRFEPRTGKRSVPLVFQPASGRIQPVASQPRADADPAAGHDRFTSTSAIK